MKQTKGGFTLIELLVVIAIIAILAAILFPVFAKAREKARQSTCTSNQKQIAIGLAMAIQENDETLPGLDVWSELGISGKVLQCPTAGKKLANAYVFNRNILTKGFAKIPNPVRTFASADGLHEATAAIPGPPVIGPTNANLAYNYSDLVARHDGNVIASFVDGHVETAKIGGFKVKDVYPGVKKEMAEKYTAVFEKLKPGGTAVGQNSWTAWAEGAWTNNDAMAAMGMEGNAVSFISRSGTGASNMGIGKSVSYPTGPEVMIEFDLMITDDISSSKCLNGTDVWTEMNFYPAGADTKLELRYVGYKDGAGKVSYSRFNLNGDPVSGNIKPNIWYSFSILMNYDTKKADIKVTSAGNTFWEAKDYTLRGMTNTAEFNRFYTRAVKGAGYTIADLNFGEAVEVTYAGP